MNGKILFGVMNHDSRNWVWHRKDERYKTDCLKLTVKNSIGVMVFGNVFVITD